MNTLDLASGAGLYIHFPWCVKKCPYCDFNSHRMGKTLDEETYINALLSDCDYELGLLSEKPKISSIFMGGGTPSLFSPDSMSRLLSGIEKRTTLVTDAEVTMEANPGTTEHADFRDYLKTGINRLSIGIQSFNENQLKRLGRVHDPDQAIHAFHQAREGGFQNINIDLMYGLPDQTNEDAVKDFEQAVALKPEHISAYQLTIEPDTVFFRYPPVLPDEDQKQIIEQSIHGLLAKSAYSRYEVSAFARDGKASRHNLNYWLFGDYLGIGAGAHGKWSDCNGIKRRSRKKHPATYISLAGTTDSIAETRSVTPQELILEFLMNALRLTDGFTLSVFHQQTGIAPCELKDSLSAVIEKGWIELDQDTVRCTPQGYLMLDSILTEFLD